MIKPKKWLYDNGHITAEDMGKRGRLSAKNKELIMAAVANGVAIEGYSVVKADKSDNTDTPAPVQVERVAAADPNRIVDVPNVTRDEREIMAYHFVDGKKKEIGMRTVDNICGSSLTYCHCENPRVWVDADVECVVNFQSRN